MISCTATTAAASVGPVLAVNITRYVQAAMSSAQEIPHIHTHPRIHTHSQSITKEYSFAPSTSGHPLRYEWVHSRKNKKERKKDRPANCWEAILAPQRWMHGRASAQLSTEPTRVFCSFPAQGTALFPPCGMYKQAPRTTLSQTRRRRITYSLCVHGAAVCTQKSRIKLRRHAGISYKKKACLPPLSQHLRISGMLLCWFSSLSFVALECVMRVFFWTKYATNKTASKK